MTKLPIVIIERLSKRHDKESFDCDNNVLNDYLKKYALQNQERYCISTTYVVTNKTKVIAYITLTLGTIKRTDLKEKYPYEELPVLLIARLAVDKNFQGQGLGKKLLKIAFKQALELTKNTGCIGVVVDAKEEAVDFYKKFGFEKINALFSDRLKMFLPIRIIKKAINTR